MEARGHAVLAAVVTAVLVAALVLSMVALATDPPAAVLAALEEFGKHGSPPMLPLEATP